MSYRDGFAALNLEFSPKIPRTEYSVAHYHWELVKRVTGTTLDLSIPENRPAATRDFLKAWDYGMMWSTYVGRNLLERAGAVITDMGHAVFGGEDYNDKITHPYETPADVYAVDPARQFAQFGTDEEKYARYYDENAPYFYGGSGTLVVDEDAKAWGIPNNDKRLIEKAISCLEQGVETERAQRVLARYTLCGFTDPADWRRWYDRYGDKLFFTEAGGWFFMVDGSRLTPGNDYSILSWRKVPEAAAAPEPAPVAKEADEPTADEPVKVSVSGSVKGEGMVEVAIHIALYKGFHIYRNVGEGDPYIPMEARFELPEGCELAGELQMPAPRPFTKAGTTVYEGKVTLTQAIRCTQVPESVKLVFSYQCCDSNICLSPQEDEFEVKFE